MDIEDYDNGEQPASTMEAGPSQDLPGTKLYANPEYEMPLTPEELEARQRRAARFARFGMPDAPVPTQDARPPLANLESYAQLRPNALHVQSDSIQNMDTSAILRWATTFVRKDQLKGMEWIDDVSGCLVFTDLHAAAAGLHGLLQDPTSLSSLGQALGRLEDIYSEADASDLEIVATPQAAHTLEGQTPAWIRFALLEDKKVKNARNESRYYAEHAPPAKAGFDDRSHQTGTARPTQEELDAELDAYTAGTEFDTSSSSRRRFARPVRGRRRASPRGQRDEEMDRLDRYEGRHQTAQARTRGLADLDAELDAYIGSDGGANQDPSSSASTSQQQQQQQQNGQPVELFPSLAGFRSDALAQKPTAVSGWNAQPSLAQRLSSQGRGAPQQSAEPSTSARPRAADLFGESSSSAPSSGMRGWQ